MFCFILRHYKLNDFPHLEYYYLSILILLNITSMFFCRYNILLRSIHTSLIDLNKGLKGLVVINKELEEVFISILQGKVPPSWGTSYPSLKPLGTWVRDLIQRIDQLKSWSDE